MLVGAENEKSKIFPYLPTQSNLMYSFHIHFIHRFMKNTITLKSFCLLPPHPHPQWRNRDISIPAWSLPRSLWRFKISFSAQAKDVTHSRIDYFCFCAFFKNCVVETKPHIVCNFLRFRSPRPLVVAQSLFKADIMIMTWVHNRALCQKCLRLMNWNLFLWKFLKLQNIIISACERLYA